MAKIKKITTGIHIVVRRNQLERAGINPKDSVFPASNDVEKEETPDITLPALEDMEAYRRERKFRKVKGLLGNIGKENPEVSSQETE